MMHGFKWLGPESLSPAGGLTVRRLIGWTEGAFGRKMGILTQLGCLAPLLASLRGVASAPFDLGASS